MHYHFQNPHYYKMSFVHPFTVELSEAFPSRLHVHVTDYLNIELASHFKNQC